MHLKRIGVALIMTVITCAGIHAQQGEALKGQWTIDLRPEPEAEGYYQVFDVKGIEENIFTGTFYGSPIENGLINTSWDRLYFAFTTRDSNHEYYHSGYLENNTLYGVSYCPGRTFTAPWTGVKE
jgi:GH43 family beta-xylosidase